VSGVHVRQVGFGPQQQDKDRRVDHSFLQAKCRVGFNSKSTWAWVEGKKRIKPGKEIT
jgi:hypothetical protein